MKILVNNQEVDLFPKLMQSKQGSSIVLFLSESTGICLIPDCHSEYTCVFGQFREDWVYEHFKDFKGEIRIVE